MTTKTMSAIDPDTLYRRGSSVLVSKDGLLTTATLNKPAFGREIERQASADGYRALMATTQN